MTTDFEKNIKSSKVVLVEFFATWCPHCQRMMPVVDALREKLAGKVNVFQYDIDKFEALSDAHGVEVVPTFIVYRDGEEVWRKSGEMTEDTILSQIDAANS